MTGQGCPVAIVGMEVLLPGAANLDAYWHNLREGVDAITEATSQRWDESFYHPSSADGPARADQVYCRRGGFVDDLVEVEVTRFGITPISVPGTEPDQLIALQVAASAITDAGGRDGLGDPERVGVILGKGGYVAPAGIRMNERVRGATQLAKTLGELFPELDPAALEVVKEVYANHAGPYQPENAIGLVSNLAASRLANRLDLRGPAYTVDAACASSLLAVDQAVTELARGRCDVVLAGGVHHVHDISFWSVFAQLRALSKDQEIRPFSRHADGTLIGEGTVVVVLKRLADAERDGDRIYAVVCGTGVASDGRTTSLFNPDPGAQARAVREAWRAAGLDPTAPGSIGLLEAHGTATPAGDTAELATLAEVFGSGRDDQVAIIGSVKSMIGHTMPVAGAAGLVKAALAIHHRTLLPTLHCEEPHPGMAATRFRPIDTAIPWEVTGSHPRRAGVNAFGFGGINAHVVLEEPPPRSRAHRRSPARVLEPERVVLLSAPDPQRLGEQLRDDDSTLLRRGSDERETGDDRCRLGVVAPTERKLAMARRVVATGTAWRGHHDIWFCPAPMLSPGETQLAFVFPGMEAEFQPRVDDVAERLGLSWPSYSTATLRDRGLSVIRLGRLLQDALLALGLAPDCVAGASVGEWTAMIAGGIHSSSAVDSFNESDVAEKWSYPDVMFAVLNLPAGEAREAIAGFSAIEISHDNSPRQCIICGEPDQIEESIGAVRRAGGLAHVLPFRSGFHTRFYRPHLGPLLAFARDMEVNPPRIPVWSAAAAAKFPPHAEGIREVFLRNLVETVRFRQTIEAMYADGIRAFVQLGVGQITSLIDETLGDKPHLAIAATSPHRAGLNQLLRVSTALWVYGRPPMAGFAETLFPGYAARPVVTAVRLDIGTPLVSLTPDARRKARRVIDRGGLRAGNCPAVSAVDAVLPTISTLESQFADLAQELSDTVAALTGTGDRAPTRAQSRPSADRDPHATLGNNGVADVDRALCISTRTMPFLLDHCFFRQRPGWPDETDRWPVVPATTLVQFMLDAAAEREPGRHAVAIKQIRFRRWLVAAPDVEVPVRIQATHPRWLGVRLGDYCEALVRLDQGFLSNAPRPWSVDTHVERRPDITARQFYDTRLAFQGPLFQGITELTAIGPRHIRGTFTVRPAPGSLLDNAGQLLGYWMGTTHSTRNRVFPMSIREICFYGRAPGPGTHVRCFVCVRDVADEFVEADMQLSVNGTVWAEIRGWRDRRFDNNPHTQAVETHPDYRMLSHRQPGGWLAVYEQWADLATRDLITRAHLGADEREEYARCPPRSRRQWLLRRIAVKDAVRTILWDNEAGPIFPAEIRVVDDGCAAPRAVGMHGRELPPLDIAVAHDGEAAVSIARETRDPRFSLAIVLQAIGTGNGDADLLTPAERARLEDAAGTGATADPVWRARVRACTRVAVRAVDAEDDDGVAILSFDTGGMLVGRAANNHLTGSLEATCRISCATLSNPPDLPARHYVVAWTSAVAS